MVNQQILPQDAVNYRDCLIIPACYRSVEDGEIVRGYGFITVYLGLSVRAHHASPDQWLSTIEGAIAVGKARVDLDYLALQYCKVETVR